LIARAVWSLVCGLCSFHGWAYSVFDYYFSTFQSRHKMTCHLSASQMGKDIADVMAFFFFDVELLQRNKLFFKNALG
jgi:hypothetical protein